MEFLLTFTDHAKQRLIERNICPDEVEYVIRFGLKEHRAGCVAYYLAKRCIPAADRRNQRICQLEGLTVLVGQPGQNGLPVITLYRNREGGLKNHRRKTKYDRREVA